jgi:hypothetical protein
MPAARKIGSGISPLHAIPSLVRRLLLVAAIVIFWIFRSPQLRNINSDCDEFSSLSSYSNIWPNMKEKICPHMVPNQNVWATLFELARMELGFPADQITAKKVDEEAFAIFFRFNAGGMGYVSQDNKQHMIYLKVFKGGNANIIHNLKGWFRKSKKNGSDGMLLEFSRILCPASDLHSNKCKSLLIKMPRITRNNTCVITAVRDPVEHFLSAYNEVMYRRFDPNSKRNVIGSTTHFEQFVRDFVGGPVSSGVYQGYQQLLEMAHLYSPSGILWGLKLLRDCQGEHSPQLTAYLPTLQNIGIEFPKMIQRHCSVPQFDPFEKQATHASQTDSYNYHATAEQVWREENATSRALCAIHALDYACFDHIPVPDICQNVYANAMFREKLLEAATMSQNDKNKSDNPCIGPEYI